MQVPTTGEAGVHSMWGMRALREQVRVRACPPAVDASERSRPCHFGKAEIRAYWTVVQGAPTMLVIVAAIPGIGHIPERLV